MNNYFTHTYFSVLLASFVALWSCNCSDAGDMILPDSRLIYETMTTEHQRREFGPFPKWTITDEGFHCCFVSMHYMHDGKFHIRDQNVSMIAALYHRNGDYYKFKFKIRKRRLDTMTWEDVGNAEINGSIQEDFSHKFNVLKQDLSNMDVHVDVRAGLKFYFLIKVQHEKWHDEIRVPISQNDVEL